MEQRVQAIDGDIVLETTTQEAVKTRTSEQEVLRRIDYLKSSIADFQTKLDAAYAELGGLYDAGVAAGIPAAIEAAQTYEAETTS